MAGPAAAARDEQPVGQRVRARAHVARTAAAPSEKSVEQKTTQITVFVPPPLKPPATVPLPVPKTVPRSVRPAADAQVERLARSQRDRRLHVAALAAGSHPRTGGMAPPCAP